MHYDSDVRKEIKAEQKEIVKAHYWRVTGAVILCVLPMVLISLIAMFMSAGGAFSAIISGDLYAIQQATEAMNSAQTLEQVLTLVVGAPLTLGLMNFLIGLMRGEEPGVSEVIQPFTSLRTLWRAIRMNLVLFLRALIWMIGPMIVFFIALVMVIFSGIDASGELTAGGVGGLIILMALFFVVIALIEVKMSMYQAGYVRLHDSEFIGTWDATREGNEAFRGHFFDLLVFFLSFAPWYLLYVGVVLLCMLPAILAESVGLLLLGLIVMLAFVIFYLPFLAAYQNMSFLRLFERLAPAPEQPVEPGAFQVNPQPGVQTPEQPFWTSAPAQPEAPETPEETQAPEAPEEPGQTPGEDEGGEDES